MHIRGRFRARCPRARFPRHITAVSRINAESRAAINQRSSTVTQCECSEVEQTFSTTLFVNPGRGLLQRSRDCLDTHTLSENTYSVVARIHEPPHSSSAARKESNVNRGDPSGQISMNYQSSVAKTYRSGSHVDHFTLPAVIDPGSRIRVCIEPDDITGGRLEWTVEVLGTA